MPDWFLAALKIASVVGGALLSRSSSRSAANKQQQGYQAATDEQARQYNQTRDDYADYREEGGNALNRLGRASTGDMSDFETSPGYNWRQSEGARLGENAFSNRSGGGNAMQALEEYRQNIASGEFGNWWNRQAGLAGAGQQAVGGGAMAGANAANQISGNYRGLADNQASIGMWNANNMNNALQGGVSNYLYGRKPEQPPGESGESQFGNPWGNGTNDSRGRPMYDFQGRRINYGEETNGWGWG